MNGLAQSGRVDNQGRPLAAFDDNGMPLLRKNPISLTPPTLAQGIPDASFLNEVSTKPVDLTLAGSNTNPDFNFGSADPLSLGTEGSGSGFDFNGALSNFSLGAQGVAGLAGAYSAFQQNKLLERQLDFQTGLANRNVANSAVVTNNSLANQANVASQLLTGAELGSAEQVASEKRITKTVDGSPVG